MITQFTIGFSRTINLGNFESCRVESSVTFAIPEDADQQGYIDIKAIAQSELRLLLEETYRNQFESRKKT